MEKKVAKYVFWGKLIFGFVALLVLVLVIYLDLSSDMKNVPFIAYLSFLLFILGTVQEGARLLETYLKNK